MRVATWGSGRCQKKQQWQTNLGTKVRSMAWSPDGPGQQRLAIAGDDGKVRILDALSGRQLLLYQGHGSTSVLSVAWSSNFYTPPYVASGDINGVIHVWNPDNGQTLFTMTQTAAVTGLASGGIFLISVGAQPGGMYVMWDLQSGQAAMQFSNDNHNTPYMNDTPNLIPGTMGRSTPSRGLLITRRLPRPATTAPSRSGAG
jgi:WD40 repeat protein